MKKTGFYIIKDKFFQDMSDPYAGIAEKSTGGRHFQACAGRGKESAECPIG